MFQRRVTAGAVAALASMIVFGATTEAGAALGGIDKQETKCGSALGKSGEKLSKTILKETGKCRDRDISGKTPGSCPDAKGLAKIGKASTKLTGQIDKKCGSTCSVSGARCLSGTLCPPNAGGSGFGEACSGGAAAIDFDMRDLGFPSPLCANTITTSADLGDCISGLTSSTANTAVDSIYGSIVNASGISADAAKCLAQLSKATQKLISTTYKGVVKCRSSNLKLLENPTANQKEIINPADCRKVDTKLAGKIAKAEAKLDSTASKKCTDAQILELDLCGNGVGGTPDIASATACLSDLAVELADSVEFIGDRTLGVASLVEAAFPPINGACGDDIINQNPSPFSKIGEECDGTSDAACPGNCLPPGDLFECTCATDVTGTIPTYRHRFIADGLQADLDSGFTGTSHNSGVTDRAGYVLEIDPTSCDCDAMDGFECIGTSADPICDISGSHAPSCSWEAFSSVKCDARGTDPDFQNEDEDCSICDEFSIGTGDACTLDSDCGAGNVCVDGACVIPCSDDGDCSPQCYPEAGGAASAPCPGGQGECAAGEVCRGQCDRSQECLIVANGAPLPISSGGTAVCVLTLLREDIFGTMNIKTGEQEKFLQQFSVVNLGVDSAIPCPVCGGICKDSPGGGPVRCSGTCDAPALDGSGSGDDCRFDDDCPVGEICSAKSDKCPGSECNLSLVCVGGESGGSPCRIEAATTKFGLVSGDCQPDPGQNISGQGLQINFFPATSEQTSLPAGLACSAPGFTLYDCPCPAAGGRETRPNLCAFACDTGAEAGVGCGNAGGEINGLPTTCSGGANAGFACDEDIDCPGAACDANPLHCTGGDPADERKGCSTNTDCGGGGVCGDACPSGRCVPLCVPGAKGDAEEGFCAAGPDFIHCSGFDDDFRLCSEEFASATCDAICVTEGTCLGGNLPGSPTGSQTPCGAQSECPSGETCCGDCLKRALCEAGVDGKLGSDDDFVGAGECIEDIRNCHVFDPVLGVNAQGTDKLDDPLFGPNNVKEVSSYCVGATSNAAINNTAGLGGQGRLRQPAVYQTNGYATIP